MKKNINKCTTQTMQTSCTETWQQVWLSQIIMYARIPAQYAVSIMFLIFWLPGMAQITRNIPADFPTIQAGINASSTGDIVLVAPGTYKENILISGKSITLASWYFTTGDPAYIAQTIIDGNNYRTALRIKSNSAALVVGFTIQNGKVYPGYPGGNIYCENSDAVIRNNIIKNGYAKYNDGYYETLKYGGGILIESCSPIIYQNQIVNNYAWVGGGGIAVKNSSKAWIIENIIKTNHSDDGGGIFCNNSKSLIKRNFLFSNYMENYGGGGIKCSNSFDTIVNNAIVKNYNLNNWVQSLGGALYSTASNIVVRNNIVYKNQAYGTSGGIYVQSGSIDLQYNNVFDTDGNYTNCSPGTGSISSNPFFVDYLNDDYHLVNPSSPCIDAGHPANRFFDIEDPSNPGYALFPALGTVRNDMGAFGGRSVPDLVGRDFVLDPPAVAAGSTISLSFSVHNQESGDASASTFKVFLSSNSTLTVDDVLLTTISIPALLGNSHFSGIQSLLIPSVTSVGQWYLLFVCDAEKSVREINEFNNLSAFPFEIIEPTSGHDLVSLDEFDRGANWWRNNVGGGKGSLNINEVAYLYDADGVTITNNGSVPSTWGGMAYTFGLSAENKMFNCADFFHPLLPDLDGKLVSVLIKGHHNITQNPAAELRIEFKTNSSIIQSYESLFSGLPQDFEYEFDIDYDLIGSFSEFVLVIDNLGLSDEVYLDYIRFTTDIPQLSDEEASLLFNLNFLLENLDPTTGLLKDKSHEAMLNIPASGMLAKIVAIAIEMGYIEEQAGTDLIVAIAEKILLLEAGPAGILPHFVDNNLSIWPNSEYSTVDSFICLLDLLTALNMIDSPKSMSSQAQDLLTSMDWEMIFAENAIIHGFSYDNQPLNNVYNWFGTEAITCAWAWASSNDPLAFDYNMLPPPTYNGAMFLSTQPSPLQIPILDRWSNNWDTHRIQQADFQHLYYFNQNFHPYLADTLLWGLSACENPEGNQYNAYGIGGQIPAFDGDGVVVPSAAALACSILPDATNLMFSTLLERDPAINPDFEHHILFSPLNALEAFHVSRTDGSLIVNNLRSSLSLALTCQGFMMRLPEWQLVIQAVTSDPFLNKGYQYLLGSPVSFAGEDMAVCEGNVLNLSLTYASHFSQLLWTTSGDGTFDDPALMHPVYTPGTSDIETGSVSLLLTATGNPGFESATDGLELSIQRLPDVYVGPDVQTNEDAICITGASAENYLSLLWSTVGDGTFNDPSTLHPCYFVGLNDPGTTVLLCLTAEPLSPCTAASTDCLALEVAPPSLPDPWSYTITGAAHNILVPLSSNPNIFGEPLEEGDWVGVFFLDDNINETCGGAATIDETGATVVTAYGNDPTTPEKDGFNAGETFIWKMFKSSENKKYPASATYDPTMPNQGSFADFGLSKLTSLDAMFCQDYDLSQGWNSISSYITPFDADVETLFSPIVDELLILRNLTKIYWPAQNINTIGDFDNASGYVLKMTDDVDFEICGYGNAAQQLALTAGWHYLPVLSECNVNAMELFGAHLADIVIVQDLIGTGVFWPAMGVYTLVNLVPGRAYKIKVVNEISLTFPECDSKTNEIPAGLVNYQETHWGTIEMTPSTQITGIRASALQDVQNGDILGAFGEQGNLYGFTIIESTDKKQVITLFGTDALSSAPNGFAEGETVSFRLFRASTGEEFDLVAVYDQSMENSTNRFVPGSLAAITNFKLSSTGSIANGTDVLEIFPNPANDVLSIRFINTHGPVSIAIQDVTGHTLYETFVIASVDLDVSSFPQGIYFVKISDGNMTVMKKFMKS